mmetsp:Transcript_7580/g.17922  ORF Transcript_7580/g.17922 Transcript_7580/m.17922 type:complete len:86 (+) Transcript_7580:3-260(+)
MAVHCLSYAEGARPLVELERVQSRQRAMVVRHVPTTTQIAHCYSENGQGVLNMWYLADAALILGTIVAHRCLGCGMVDDVLSPAS